MKLGDEARPEVTASRLLWAVGYFVDDDYLLDRKGEGPADYARRRPGGGRPYRDARFEKKPEGEKKIGIWRWKDNPFSGTKEFNGLRVMMAVMNNWDLKDENNGVYEDRDQARDFLTRRGRNIRDQWPELEQGKIEGRRRDVREVEVHHAQDRCGS